MVLAVVCVCYLPQALACCLPQCLPLHHLQRLTHTLVAAHESSQHSLHPLLTLGLHTLELGGQVRTLSLHPLDLPCQPFFVTLTLLLFNFTSETTQPRHVGSLCPPLVCGGGQRLRRWVTGLLPYDITAPTISSCATRRCTHPPLLFTMADADPNTPAERAIEALSVVMGYFKKNSTKSTQRLSIHLATATDQGAVNAFAVMENCAVALEGIQKAREEDDQPKLKAVDVFDRTWSTIIESVKMHHVGEHHHRLTLTLPEEIMLPADFHTSAASQRVVLEYHQKIKDVERDSQLLIKVCHYRRGKLYLQLQAMYPDNWKRVCEQLLGLSYMSVLRHIDFFKICDAASSPCGSHS
eukprot:m.411960 g.411960  ORF g.411960 m.411960 type:complete len:353 (-) comp20168_c0_seq10:850-1908(-)